MVLINATQVQFNAKFTEPTKSADGSALTDLATSVIYTRLNGGVAAATLTVPATSPNGGGTINTTLIVPAPNGVKTKIEAWVTSKDSTGNESGNSNVVTVDVDRVGPDVPVNFSLV